MKSKKYLAKALTITLGAVFTLGTVGCNNGNGGNHPTLPDYSQVAKEYDFFAYSGPMRGKFNIDGIEQLLGTDQRTVEGYTTFKEAGFNVAMLTGSAGLNTMGDTLAEWQVGWPESECYRVMTNAYAAGIDRIIISDGYLTGLIEYKDNLLEPITEPVVDGEGNPVYEQQVDGDGNPVVDGDGNPVYVQEVDADGNPVFETVVDGEGNPVLDGEGNPTTVPVYKQKVKVTKEAEFESLEALTAYCKERMQLYINQPGFYGLNLRDEPGHEYAKSYSWTYKAVKAAAAELGMENIYIHMNLLPLTGTLHTAEYESLHEAYTDYIRKYLEYSDSNRISIDVYAFRDGGITGAFYPTIQIALDQCKKYGADLTFCVQSFEMYTEAGYKAYRGIGKSEMMLELYSLMGMGLDDFAYYTYQPPESSGSGNPTWGDYTFLNAAGEKNNVYYYGQEVMANAQAMSDIILNYEYQGGYFYLKDIPTFATDQYLAYSTSTSMAYFHNDHEFNSSVFKGATHDNDALFVTELKDETNDLWMYMVQNVVDPMFGKDGRTATKAKVTFDSSYTWVAELKDGRLEYVKLNGGVYEKTLSAGHAVYLIPLK